MLFPLSNKDLQNYRSENLVKEQILQRKVCILTEICSGVENTLINTNSTKYVYGAERHLVYDSVRLTQAAFPQHLVIETVLIDLKQKFPDSIITLDPLKKTITIDWSA